jgi:hypothetical protein
MSDMVFYVIMALAHLIIPASLERDYSLLFPLFRRWYWQREVK